MNIVNLVAFGVLVYCIVQFFSVTETNEMLKWGLGIIICSMFNAMIKLYAWMQMDKNAILREMKRLEFQVLLFVCILKYVFIRINRLCLYGRPSRYWGSRIRSQNES